jgi:hypothetical protein
MCDKVCSVCDTLGISIFKMFSKIGLCVGLKNFLSPIGFLDLMVLNLFFLSYLE